MCSGALEGAGASLGAGEPVCVPAAAQRVLHAAHRCGCLHRFAVSNAHALLLVFGGGSAVGLLSWRGAGAAADAWLASARHGRGQDVGGVCIGVLRALFALPQARPAAPPAGGCC